MRRRTWAGLPGFVAIEAGVFCRYTNIVVLGCAVLAVLAAWRLPGTRLPAAALGWWLGSVAVFGAGVAIFDDLAYGGPLRTGYPAGLITFSLGAVLPNVRYLPVMLIVAMPMLVLGLVALAWIIWRWMRLRRAGAEPAAVPGRDLAVGLAQAAAWFSVWGLYAAYTWTAISPGPIFSPLDIADDVRFYVDPIGPIALLAAWLVTRVPRRASLALLTSAAVVAATFGLGVWSFNTMRQLPAPAPTVLHPTGGRARAPVARHRRADSHRYRTPRFGASARRRDPPYGRQLADLRYLVLTHFHADHIGAAADIAERNRQRSSHTTPTRPSCAVGAGPTSDGPGRLGTAHLRAGHESVLRTTAPGHRADHPLRRAEHRHSSGRNHRADGGSAGVIPDLPRRSA